MKMDVFISIYYECMMYLKSMRWLKAHWITSYFFILYFDVKQFLSLPVHPLHCTASSLQAQTYAQTDHLSEGDSLTPLVTQNWS